MVSAGTEKMVVDLARKSLVAKAQARPDLVRKVINTARKQGILNTLRKVQTKLDTPIPLGYSSAGVIVELGEQVAAREPDHPHLPVPADDLRRGGMGTSRNKFTYI